MSLSKTGQSEYWKNQLGTVQGNTQAMQSNTEEN